MRHERRIVQFGRALMPFVLCGPDSGACGTENGVRRTENGLRRGEAAEGEVTGRRRGVIYHALELRRLALG